MLHSWRGARTHTPGIQSCTLYQLNPLGAPQVLSLAQVESQCCLWRLAWREAWVFPTLSGLMPQVTVKTVRVKVRGIQKPKVTRCGMDK